MTTADHGADPAPAFIGVDLGGTKILARWIDPVSGRAGGRHKAVTPTTGPDDVLEAVAETVRALDPEGRAVAVGVGVPGFVVDGRVVVRCANIAGWDHPIDVAEHLGAALYRPVVVGNDVNCGALAEFRLSVGQPEIHPLAHSDRPPAETVATTARRDLLAVFVGTGVGGGLILDGRLVTGPRGMVGEIGHVTTIPGGAPCGCGGRGHLEAYAGRAGLERRAREAAAAGRPNKLVDLAGLSTIKSRHLARALEEGCEVTAGLVVDAADALALVIGNAATVLDLRHVVLGGGVVDKLGQPFVDQIAASPSFGGLGPDLCALRLARRLDDGGVVGAAILAADRFG
ncbi:MAG: ROK family protein [Acidimicrobiia bacterium]|nr:ROK family protein [Acidimicrobiia bacterium]MDH5289742.1 ROK family protein [Acidimicrobiia bacterium]